MGDKYIKMLSGKYNLYGQPEIVNGVDSGSTNWHNDLKEVQTYINVFYKC